MRMIPDQGTRLRILTAGLVFIVVLFGGQVVLSDRNAPAGTTVDQTEINGTQTSVDHIGSVRAGRNKS
jgi:hypothetical protein